MAFPTFEVGPEKGLVRASCTSVPKLMLICGPNGVGKSTLLHLLKRRPDQAEPGTEIIYIGPHRAWRRSSIRASFLYDQIQTYRGMLTLDQLPGFQHPGLQYVSAFPRSPDYTDESPSLAKYGIAKLEQRRKDKITTIFDERGGEVPKGSLSDIWAPLRSLVEALLPHLIFERIDATDSANIRCIFRRVDGDTEAEIDIDDFSSGERAVVALFLPFLEHQISGLLEKQPHSDVTPTALIDEPDLHLHPLLQVSFLDYLRRLAAAGEAQFILTTHSPSLIESATSDELFLLAPVAAVADGNQLVRVASDTDKLETLREITGAAHIITRGRPIVFIEGEAVSGRTKPTDQLLIQLMLPESKGWVLVPGGGRTQTLGAARRLREALPEGLPGIAAYCLLDNDRGGDGDPDWAISWPVAEIENLLLVPRAMFEFLEPYSTSTGLRDEQAVAGALDEIAASLDDNEMRLRIHERAPELRVRFDDVVGDTEATAALLAAGSRFQDWISSQETEARLQAAMREAKAEVEAIIRDGRRLQAFKGKHILKRFFDRYVHPTGLSYANFVIELARFAANDPAVKTIVSQAFDKLRLYVPEELPALLESLKGQVAEDIENSLNEIIPQVREARREFQEGKSLGVGRQELRARLIRLARGLGNNPALAGGRADLARLTAEMAP